jgi:hypothetical protein
LYDACNNFDAFFDNYIKRGNLNPEEVSGNSRVFDSDAITKDFVYPATIADSIRINETTECRII